MSILFSIFAVGVLILLAVIGVKSLDWHYAFAVGIPYAALAIFILGVLYRVFKWARSAVPFRISTTCGQQKSLSWIKADNLENPHNTRGVIGRMLLEVLLFRSLFRNDRFEVEKPKKKLRFTGNRYLWLGGLVFHWSLLIILIRHTRLFTEPTPPGIVDVIRDVDSFTQNFIPVLYVTDMLILIALTFLFLRRVVSPQMRYISFLSDYFAVLLIFSVALSGVLMRAFYPVSLVEVKMLAMSVLRFDPAVPEGMGLAFYVHLTLVCALIAYLPFSKLVHLGGVFLSPTRNLANNNRVQRHVNPWDYPVKVHTYEEYEDEFRGHMKDAGLPLEKE